MDDVKKRIDERVLGLNAITICNKGLGSNIEFCRTGTIVNCRDIRKHDVGGNGEHFRGERCMQDKVMNKSCGAEWDEHVCRIE